MARALDSDYRAVIEALSEREDFEKEGDRIFLAHPDREARLLWAFHRPGGSHPSQLSDSDAEVAAMGFSHSRLGALQRFRLLNPEVLKSEPLRQKISKRVRMLFRSLADDDFKEMAAVVKEFGIYAALSVDQLINGRKMIEEIKLHLSSVNSYLYLVSAHWHDGATAALKNRLMPIPERLEERSREILEELKELGIEAHPVLKSIVAEILELGGKRASHPLKKIALQNEAKKLKE